MFGFVSKRTPDVWRLELGFSHQAGKQQQELTWSGSDSEAAVLASLHEALNSDDLVHEDVRVQLATGPPLLQGVVAAAGFTGAVRLSLSVQTTRAQLTSVGLSRVSGSNTLSTSVALALWSALDVGQVTRLRVADAGAVAALADARVLSRFAALRVLNLSHAGLGALPPAVGLLTQLQELRVVGNQLRILPPEVGKLTQLRVLAADSNQLTILPGELRQCTLLEELTLQHNRLTSVLLSFASLRHLSVLHLYDNPLEFLPEISPCAQLRHLTVANLRVTADPGYAKYKVEFMPPPPSSSSGSIASIALWDSGKSADKLRPIFSLMLRRSSGHHPLLAGALHYLAEEDPKNRELMARQENGLQQLVLMALSDNPLVVEETCHTLTLLAEHSPALADAVLENDANAIMRLLPTADERRQLSTLRLLAAIAYSSMAASAKLATDALLHSLEQLVGSSSAGTSSTSSGTSSQEAVRTAALKAIGNLAFCAENRGRLQRRAGLMQRLSQLALSKGEPIRVQVAALRVLAVLGENDLVDRAVGRAPITGRGLRILSMDGGGMKGMATVRLLRELERQTGRRVHELFDLIVGTSTGGLLAVAVGLRKLSLDDCSYIYKTLGRRVFSRIVPSKEGKEEGWMESFYRTFQNKTSHVRAVVVGYKHDAAVYESILHEECDFSKQERCIGDAMIDTAGLDVPKVALVSTLASLSPAPPFVFRTYQLPPASEELAAQISAHAGSCKHPVWQAVRASSAASFYLEDFCCGGDKFQDGAVTANNPAVIAVQEARLLWPDHPIDVLVSLGVGLAPPTKREKGLSSFMETGSILIESSTNVQRAQEALATLLPLVPGVKYFRFCARDPRCSMELDEIDPERWADLEAATDEYIAQPATQTMLADAAAALLQAPGACAAPAQAGLKLGARRKLVVLRAPRLAAQQASLDDAVAASLAFRPGCVASVNLQQLSLADAEPGAGSAADQTASAGGVTVTTRPPSHTQDVQAAAALQTQQDGSPQQEQDGSEGAEGGGLTAYLSSWFGSPTKQPKALLPPPAEPASSSAAPPPPASSTGQQQGSRHVSRQGSAALEAVCGSSTSSRQAVQAPAAQTPALHQDSGPGAGGSAALSDLLVQLEERLSPLLPTVGVVHLGLEQAGDHGPVLRWRQGLQVVAEPSEQASAVLEAAGHDAAGCRLLDVFSQRPSIELPGRRTLTVLSSQTQWAGGQPLSTLLLSATSPSLVLPATSASSLGWLLRGQLVVCTATVQPGLVEALLAAGAKGVVCGASGSGSCEAAGHPCSADECCAYFAVFYDALLGGGLSAQAALHAADEQHPSIAGSYELHTHDTLTV